MTPATKFLRRLLFLPVHEAEQREQILAKTTADLNKAKHHHNRAGIFMREKSDDLRSAYDDLLGRLNEPN